MLVSFCIFTFRLFFQELLRYCSLCKQLKFLRAAIKVNRKAMKKLLFLILLSCFGCSSQTKVNPSLDVVSTQDSCPTDGICKVEAINNKRLVIKYDSLGDLYYELEESKTTTVIKYAYNRKSDNDLADGTYREELLFEINSNTMNLDLSGKELQETKMLFGRFCYCKGQTGYYKIENGTLKMDKQKDKVALAIQFQQDQVPQVLSAISFFLDKL